MKAFIPLTFVRLSDGFLAPFHPRWNHWNYVEAEPCSDSEGNLSGRVPGGRAALQPVLLPQSTCSRLLPREVPVFLFCILTKALAKLTPRQTFHWNQDIATCER